MHRYFFDKILYISQSVYDYLKSIKVSDERLFCMYDSVKVSELNSTESSFRREFGIQQDAIVIGTFTSLYRKKGVYDFAMCAKEILKEHKDAYIIFGGEIEQDVKDEIQKMFDESVNIIFTGFRDDAVNVMKAFDVYIFASHTEGLGTVLLEAMSAKTPIIVYDIEPMNKLIKHDERGLCATYLDVNSLAQNALKLIANKECGERYSKNAVEFVLKNYDEANLKQNLKNLLESL